MAQHDYVIANGTGAAVRSDLNNALAAIVSNNSGATEPSPTYAYQWWPDTTTGLLKIRNAANNAWVTVGTLATTNLGLAPIASPTFTGTVTGPTFTASTGINIPVGSAGSPTLYFTGDTNTGIYSPGADQVAISTAGSARLYVSSAGLVGVGTTSPSQLLHVNSTGTSAVLRVSSGSAGVNTSTSSIQLSSAFSGSGVEGTAQINANAPAGGQSELAFLTSASGNSPTERARIDSSGRLLVGTSSTSGNSDAQTALIQTIGNSSGSFQGGRVNIGRAEFSANITSGEQLGGIYFSDAQSGTYGVIECVADGTGGTNDFPGRLVFSTTADGASSPTERMRIKNNGEVVIATNTLYVGSGSFVSYQAERSSDGQICQWYRSGVNVGTISVTTTATSYNTSSDYRLKENIEVVTDAIDRLKALKPCRFNFIADPDKTVDGFIAHEAAEVVPECVSGEKDAVDADGKPVYQGIDQSKLVPLLTAALQEAIWKIENLEQRLDDAGIS